MAQALKSTGAETVRWNLSDLFASPDDPKIEATLAREMQRAKDFEARYKGKVATLEPKAFAAMMRELEDYEKAAAKPEVYAYMLHSGDTQDHAAGRLLARVREAGAERSSHMVFFYLELAQISDEQAASTARTSFRSQRSACSPTSARWATRHGSDCSRSCARAFASTSMGATSRSTRRSRSCASPIATSVAKPAAR